MKKIKVYEFDFVFRKKLDEGREFDDIEAAREYAKTEASKWCEDEKPFHGGFDRGRFEIFRGFSDFGMLIDNPNKPDSTVKMVTISQETDRIIGEELCKVL